MSACCLIALADSCTHAVNFINAIACVCVCCPLAAGCRDCGVRRYGPAAQPDGDQQTHIGVRANVHELCCEMQQLQVQYVLV